MTDKALRTLEPLLGTKHRFSTHGRREKLPAIADAVRVTTMLVNLLDNAIKYSPGGGDIEVAWRQRAGLAHISVTDQGVGISRTQRSMLFTRFGRLVTPETSHIRGTGLGLYLAREIARLHDGDIVVRSHAGRGTTFTRSGLPSLAHRPEMPTRPGAGPGRDRLGEGKCLDCDQRGLETTSVAPPLSRKATYLMAP
jgi:signal transduction histidine kinase